MARPRKQVPKASSLAVSPKQMEAELKQLRLKKEQISEKKRELAYGLPHLYGWKWYHWAKQFFDSTNRMNLLTAANQCSKSTTNIRKAIYWATEKTLWPKLWRTTPTQFWYMYPDERTLESEYETKWKKEVLPRGKYAADLKYGFKEEMHRGTINALRFSSGLVLYFKTYTQKPSSIQASTSYAVFADEEMPVTHYPEIQARLTATNGYFHMVFTATLNQDMWRRAMEAKGEQELFPEAFKQTVSLYDCLNYMDGTLSPWTPDRIRQIEQRCSSETEVQRRVYGRFVTEEGRKYHAFEPTRHFTKRFPIPHDYKIYCCVDPGSGGQTGHPAGILFLAVNPSFTCGYVYKAWRGDGIATTSSDILEKFRLLRAADKPVMQLYDYAAADFGLVAQAVGEGFTKADKSKTLGDETLNTLFKNNMLFLFDDDPEIAKLGSELSILKNVSKRMNQADDLSDPLKYCALQVPWDWSVLPDSTKPALQNKMDLDKPWAQLTALERKAWEIRERRGLRDEKKEEGAWGEFEEELKFWNEEYGN